MNSADDPGLARERTALSWQRTAVAFAGVGLLLLAGSLRSSAAWVFGPAAGLALAAAVGASHHGRAGYAHRLRGASAPATGPLRAVMLTTIVVGITAALLAVFS